MGSCCDNNCAVEALRERQRGTLTAVLLVNAVMFVVIVAAALYGRSTALLSDSLDNLGDALTYGLSLYVVAQGLVAKARVALIKGGLIFLAACAVVVQIIQRLLTPELPSYEVMGTFSIAGLLANSFCLWLLWQHRNDDINMSSVWECSRNDIIVNLSVFVAAGGVWLFASRWPDIVVASTLVVLLLRSSWRVISAARQQLAATAETN